MKGSVSRCTPKYSDIATRNDLHINGNALYCLHSPGFRSYREAVHRFYPKETPPAKVASGCATGGVFEGGYDHALYRYRTVKENFAVTQKVISK
jgi:hypothetical protein